jgi:uncharacterized protein YmfQ (DUF2313 family)
MPRGRAWTRAVGTMLHDYLVAISREYDRLEARTEDLLRESTPEGADELLPEWEELTGATGCSTAGSLELRREAVIARLRGGAPTWDALRDLAEGAGYGVEFETWRPFVAGGSQVGDSLTNDEWQHAAGIRFESLGEDNDAAFQCTVSDLLHAHVVPVYVDDADWLMLSTGLPITLSGGQVVEVSA